MAAIIALTLLEFQPPFPKFIMLSLFYITKCYCIKAMDPKDISRHPYIRLVTSDEINLLFSNACHCHKNHRYINPMIKRAMDNL